ncbi:alpha/beta-hydrolase [Hyaloscypha variabilis F]|uniref:Alpha/beta-hydrolase n=1 Tax=Hyaloscypha variabilis (strain UAMH 11265 / GT02V1 / F) TaxID=1149755 RepID=A0A2J6RL70_HYAVF|nr:alpha/beta-hydrolase [Hyaloscypha variabilis F]
MSASEASPLLESSSDTDKLISDPPAYYLRIAYFIGVWAFKAIFTLGLGAKRLLFPRPPNLLHPEPKTYPIRPTLKSLVYRPQDSGDEPLPVYLNCHGGGWAVADPAADEEACSFLARNFNILVVSVDYHKSPKWKFPFAVEDIAAIADALLNDKSLNIDTSKVAMGGFSAGANLAFAACQLPVLKGRVHALVGFCPVLNQNEKLEEKLARRPKDAGTDGLESSARFLDWAYVPYGTNRNDPLLSPGLAKKEDLPRWAYLVGAEYDCLCYEAHRLAERLADPEAERKSIPDISTGEGWSQASIRWECAKRQIHAFTHVAEWTSKKEKERVKMVDELYHRVGTWLKEEVWTG